MNYSYNLEVRCYLGFTLGKIDLWEMMEFFSVRLIVHNQCGVQTAK